jgi:hypothetical protein
VGWNISLAHAAGLVAGPIQAQLISLYFYFKKEKIYIFEEIMISQRICFTSF